MRNPVTILASATVAITRWCRLPSPVNLVGILENAADAKRRIRGVVGYRRTTVGGAVLGALLLAALAAVALTNSKERTTGATAGGAPAASRDSGGFYVFMGPAPLWLPRAPYLELDRLPGSDPVPIHSQGYEESSRWGEAFRLARQSDGVVAIEVLWRLPTTQSSDPATSATAGTWYPLVYLAPSRTVRGDLDLVAESWPDARREQNPRVPFPVYLEKHTFAYPMLSRLHRFADPRARDFFRLTEVLRKTTDWNTGAAAPDRPTTASIIRLDLAERMAADAPDDPFVRVLYLDAVAADGDVAKLRTELDTWRPQFEKWPVLHASLRRFEWTLHAADLSAAGRNASDFLESLYGVHSTKTALARLQELPAIRNYEECAKAYQPFSPPYYPGYWDIQWGASWSEAGAVLLLLQGERERALDTAAADYRVGQLIEESKTDVGDVLEIGASLRERAIRQMELCVLNAYEQPDDVLAAWQKIDQLNSRERRETLDDICSRLVLGLCPDETERKAYYEVHWGSHSVLTEGLKRADAQFQLLRMATAARYHFLKTGRFPAAANEFDLLPLGVLPTDPFGNGPLRFAQKPDALVCYSVGPDGKDDGGAITYDPSNGTKSGGNIVLEVPRERKYPFPAGGVKARDKADFVRQFPNGLPTDVFARRTKDGKASLGVTDTSPVTVYSRGPDGTSPADEGSNERNAGKPFLPFVTYDPTNGSNSGGDIWLAVPPPGAQTVRAGVETAGQPVVVQSTGR